MDVRAWVWGLNNTPKAMGEKFSIGHIGGIQGAGIVKGIGAGTIGLYTTPSYRSLCFYIHYGLTICCTFAYTPLRD